MLTTRPGCSQETTYKKPTLKLYKYISGVLGPTYSSEAQVVSSILGSQIPSDRFLLLGYSSTSTVLNDRTMYPNFYRVIPEDSVQITVS